MKIISLCCALIEPMKGECSQEKPLYLSLVSSLHSASQCLNIENTSGTSKTSAWSSSTQVPVIIHFSHPVFSHTCSNSYTLCPLSTIPSQVPIAAETLRLCGEPVHHMDWIRLS